MKEGKRSQSGVGVRLGMGKEIVNQVQEAQGVPCRINPRGNTPRHIAIKLAKIKDKEKLLKATRENDK